MNKLYVIGGILVILLGISSGVVYEKYVDHSYKAVERDDYNIYYQKYEDDCLMFVRQNHLMDQEEVDTLSLVLYMEYLLDNEAKKEFDEVFRFIKTYLLQADGLIMGKVHGKSEVGAANNAYESMQLMSLLIEAYELWDDTTYRDVALNIERSLYEHNVKDDYLYSLYNIVAKKADGQIDLSQLKLRSMVMFAEYRSEWKNVYQQSKQLTQKAYISDTLPFYGAVYDTKENQYIQAKKLNMEDSLQIVLNLAEVGSVENETIEWLKAAMKEGAVYEEYDVVGGKANIHTEAPAIYALIARLGKEIGDNELYTLGIEKMLSFQIKDDEQTNYGALIKLGEEKISLYDNIQGLLAF